MSHMYISATFLCYIYVILLAFTRVVAAGSDDFSCPRGSKYSTELQKCILPMSVDSFYNAEFTCVRVGGHLPSVHCKEQNTFIADAVKKYFACTNTWLGVDARATWFDGSNLDYNNFNDTTSTGQYTCTALTTTDMNNYWYNFNCSSFKPYFCTLPPVQVNPDVCNPPPTVAPTSPISITTSTMSRSTMRGAHFDQDNGSCRSALLAFANDTTTAREKLDDARAFITQAVSDCTATSELAVITPGAIARRADCNRHQLDSSGLNQELDINLQDVMVASDKAAQTIVDMFDYMNQNCKTSQTPSEGRAVYLLTDLPCSSLCQNPLTSSQDSIIKQLMDAKIVAVFIYVGTDETEAKCFQSIWLGCMAYAPSQCDHKTTIRNTSDAVAAGITYSACSTSSNSSSSYTIWALLTTIGFVILILFCVIWRCYRRYKDGSDTQRNFRVVALNQLANGQPNTTSNEQTAPPPVARENDYARVYMPTADEWEVDLDKLTVIENKMLGSGAFAAVYEGTLEGDIPLSKIMGNLKLGIKKDISNRYKVAIKRLPPYSTQEGRADFMHEIKFMKELGYHPHILSLLGCVTTGLDPMIVLENCQNGDLLSFVRSKKDRFRLDEEVDAHETGMVLRVKDLVSIAWQVADGMTYLTSHNFIHRDIAARNVLLTTSMVAKIGDFGLCRLVDSSLYTAKGGRLPIKWMALESLKYYEYSLKSDVWSFGVLLFELFSLGEAPYMTIQPNDMPKYLEDGNRLPQPEKCPNEIYAIMKSCWEAKADDRPDVSKVREEITMILNTNSANYGYLAIGSDASAHTYQEIDDDDGDAIEKDEDIVAL